MAINKTHDREQVGEAIIKLKILQSHSTLLNYGERESSMRYHKSAV